MPKVTCTQEIPAAAYSVWSLLRNFNGLVQWIEAVKSSSADGVDVGSLRTLTLQDGSVIVEKLESTDDNTRSLSYSIVSGPLPVADYLATLTVTPIDELNCSVEWTGTCTAAGASDAEVETILNDLYSGGLRDLCRRYPG